MSRTEQINEELAALQQELGKLKSYTDDIGTASDASANVVKASQKFTTAFQKNINTLVGAMEDGARDFQQTCAKSSDQLHKASVRFDADIDRSQKLLDVLGKQLDATSTRVVQMTGEIRQMDIPGRFSTIANDIQATEVKLLSSGQELKNALERIALQNEELKKVGKTRFIIDIVIGLVAIVLLAYVSIKVV